MLSVIPFSGFVIFFIQLSVHYDFDGLLLILMFIIEPKARS